MWEQFERNATITIDDKGGMTVTALNLWPKRCLRICQEDLAQVTQDWQPLLEDMVGPQGAAQVMANPHTGDDWRAYGPLLSLSFGSTSETSAELLWEP